MTIKGLPTSHAQARSEQAATWRVRIEADESVARSPAFLAWLEDPDNLEAYGRACAAWGAVEDHLAASELIAVRRDALAYLRRQSLLRLVPRAHRLYAVAAVVAVCLLAGVGLWQYLLLPAEYRTGVGQRLVVTLEDGSRISLDSDTAVQVRFEKNARRLVLEQGRARFDVAHDIARPFTVTAGKETVVAVGTSFDVERLGEKVLVTLIEGHVVVKSAATGSVSDIDQPNTRRPKPLALNSGQQLVVADNAKPVIKPADLPVVTAWESGRLILNNEPLGEAVERVNRYTDKPLLVDPAIAQLRVSGVFNAGDVATFVDAITTLFPVQASVNDANQTVLQKRS